MSQSVQSRKAISIASVILFGCWSAIAQNPQLEEKVMTLKQNQEINKQKLAQYSWQETETISIKGNVKDTKVYQIQMVNGQQQKTEIRRRNKVAAKGA